MEEELEENKHFRDLLHAVNVREIFYQLLFVYWFITRGGAPPRTCLFSRCSQTWDEPPANQTLTSGSPAPGGRVPGLPSSAGFGQGGASKGRLSYLRTATSRRERGPSGSTDGSTDGSPPVHRWEGSVLKSCSYGREIKRFGGIIMINLLLAAG